MNSTIVSQLRKQAAHLKDQLARTEAAIEALTGYASSVGKVGRKRKMSAAARAKIPLKEVYEAANQAVGRRQLR